MLNHRFVTAIYGLTILSLLVIDNVICDLHISMFLVPSITYLGIIAWGSSVISSNYHINALCENKETKENHIAISFDDGPHAQITPEVLDILKKTNTTATFFCIGKNIYENKDLLKRIVDEGHLLGNHSFSHSYFFDFWGSEKVLKDLSQTTKIIEEICGKKTKLFRPPYGVSTPAIADSVTKLDLLMIGWNIRSFDTVVKDEQKIIDSISKKLKPGSIILFHDRLPSTCSLLEKTIKLCKDKGYKIIGLDQLLSVKAYD